MPSISVVFNNEEILGQSMVNDVYTIGRQQSCDIHIDNLGISRVHARIMRQGDGYIVEDLKSSNGTFVNAERIQAPRKLTNGDQITIGKYTIIYSAEDSGENPAAASAPTVATHPAADVMPGFDDVFSTMAMDTEQIRKKMMEMKQAKSSDTGPVLPPPPAPKSSAEKVKSAVEIAEDRAKKAEAAMRAQTRTHILIGAGVFVALIIAAVIAFFLLK